MSIAVLIKRLQDMGATPEIILVVVEAVDAARTEADAILSARRANESARQRRYRARGGGDIPEELRKRVFERDKFLCVDCNSSDYLHCDHIDPVNNGGLTTYENLQTLCRVCNAKKKDRIRKTPSTEFRGKRGWGSEEIAGKSPAPPPEKERSPIPPKEKLTLSITSESLKRASAFDPIDPFDEFWSLYPHKVAKGAARKPFARVLAHVGLVAILEGVDRYIAAKPAHIAYANPATWLNGERWDDQPKHEGGDQGPRTAHPSFRARDGQETTANYAAAYTAPSRNPR